ncbi:hypothetical protein [Streptomyces sp. NPDC020747]|uniref:hypothetical protein n=1 Tax=Streptomyces sp. NPDC020747 TaxID=3365086 RepID=UPI0037AE053F
MLTVVNEDGTTPSGSSLLDEIVREGVRRMPAAALEAEVNAYIAELSHERGGDGRRLVVRDGYQQPREVTASAGAVQVKAPQVNDAGAASQVSRDHVEGEECLLLVVGAPQRRRDILFREACRRRWARFRGRAAPLRLPWRPVTMAFRPPGANAFVKTPLRR